ncbi:tyrosine-type recombinase/integrase [Bradyrhizobium erythrophlei]|uniref:Site-specific recombinase XerD n=1 Tax=Bradyrhizobium erythrophlei TaxID=1437360 RepID=A0A1M5TBH7_9BRAD|nr:tyrosine-type recombinase/integrase [Bradyrhizobium erythrophlei]SHH48036.1 Site-specific recombinase XerD [Bradyrhizobium erythrophlei]
MLLKQVFDSYMVVSGEARGAAYMDRLMFNAFDKFFPKYVPEISPVDLTDYLKDMRAKKIKRNGVLRPLQPATLNKHTQFLRRLLSHAEALGVTVQRFRWKAFLVMEAEQKTSYLTIPEEHTALVGMDDYIRPLFLFSVLSGVRQANAIDLRWDQVDMDDRIITFQAKSRRPGGKQYTVPLTGMIEGVLEGEWGNHIDRVFTFVARRTSRWGYEAGKRYPLTKPLVRNYWEKLGLEKRWHDLRHTFGTRLYQESKDIHLVQRAMNHADVNTTMRYIHTDVSDIRQQMENMHNKVANLHQQEQVENKPVPKFSRNFKMVRSKGLEPSLD